MSYVGGNSTLIVFKCQDNLDNYDVKEVNSVNTDNVVVLYEEGGTVKIDGVYEYGYGLWTKFLMTSPERLAEKPDSMEIARFASYDGYTDSDKIGDRVLSTFIGRGVYNFATYNGKLTNTYSSINYADKLDGYWNYIYFGYSRSLQRATALVYFGSDRTIQR